MSTAVEQRRHARAPINSPATFTTKGAAGTTESILGLAKDISVGGMFLETTAPAPFGAEVIVRVVLPGTQSEVALPGVVRWIRDGGMGIQFGNLGAKETHIITEIGRAHSSP